MALQNDYIHIVVNPDETRDIYFFDDKLKGKQKNDWKAYFDKDFLKSKNIATFKVEDKKIFATFHILVKIEEWQEINEAKMKEDIKFDEYEISKFKKLTDMEIELKKQEKADIYNAYDVIMYAYWRFYEQYPEFIRITKQE